MMWIELCISTEAIDGLMSIVIDTDKLISIGRLEESNEITLCFPQMQAKVWQLYDAMAAAALYNALVLALMGTSTELGDGEYVRVIKE